MRIKTKKKLKLPELIQHIMDNEELRDMYYYPTPLRGIVKVSKSGDFLIEGVYSDDTFTVEVEEELTEEIVFDELVFVYGDYEHRLLSGSMVRKSIQNILEYKTPIYKIYALVDRSLVLIWSAESGIPEKGVLEVDTE